MSTSSRIEDIPVIQILRNPLNPRLDFDETKLSNLQKSIGEVGVLVAITVYWDDRQEKFVLIDGERRWICSRRLGYDTIPAIVIPEPDPDSHLLRMFSIHHLREKWSLIATTLKLEQLMKMRSISDSRELSALTGMSTRTINRCKTILSYDRKYLDILLKADKNEKIKPDFFVELSPVLTQIEQLIPQFLEEKDLDEIIEVLIDKFRTGKIPWAKEFRKIRKLMYEIEKQNIPNNLAYRFFKQLIEIPDTSIERLLRDLELEYLTESEEIIKVCNSLKITLSKIRDDDILRDQRLQNTLVSLNTEIMRLLK